MNIVELIEKKKRGGEYSFKELKYIVENYMSGEIADYQMSAILMAIHFQGLSIEETAHLTELTVKSGKILDFSEISSDVVDKHSTGGVGDKITLILLPLLAAAGVCTAKLSGRGLGFTGGTIDKLESIPGFNTDLKTDEFCELVKSQKGAIAAQTADLTPADGKMYALRDVTATVDIIPLIACSVVSKKIASGANHIVLDVKCGNGAFINNIEQAEVLAGTMVEIGKRLGRNICCLITNMNMPLGRAVGNSLEVIEVIEFLKGNTCDDLAELTYEQAALSIMLCKKRGSFQMENGKWKMENEPSPEFLSSFLAKKFSPLPEGEGKSSEDTSHHNNFPFSIFHFPFEKNATIEYLKSLVKSGEALKKFKSIIENQGGDSRILDDYSLLPHSGKQVEVKAKCYGYVSDISAIKIAKACKLLGAGRTRKEDSIDYGAGIYLNKKYGEKVSAGETIATLHVNDEKNLAESVNLVEEAYSLQNDPPPKLEMIYKRINC